MPFDQELDERLAAAMAGGNMVCGVNQDCLILRLGPAEAAQALSRPHVKPFDLTGKPMKGWIMVEKAGLSDPDLRQWLSYVAAPK